MSKTYTKDEVLENGYHKIRVYDVDSQCLLSTYQTTPDGKKDGKQIYYSVNEDVVQEVEWKEGVKFAEKINYQWGLSDKYKYTKYFPNGKKSYELTEKEALLPEYGIGRKRITEVSWDEDGRKMTESRKIIKYDELGRTKESINIVKHFKNGREHGECIIKNIRACYKEGKLEGSYTEFFDKIDGKKKVEGFYKEGKKEGVWKYYDKDGTVIHQEYWHEGNDCTKKYEVLKKVASKRIEEENKLSEGKDERVVLPKMTAREKRKAVREARKDLSR